MTLPELNTLVDIAAYAELERCCGCARWVWGVLARRPFRSLEEVAQAADEVWWGLSEIDWLEAFAHHPKIGDVGSLRQKFASTAHWASDEQAGAGNASEETLRGLAEGNRLYEEKFGYVFIVCATGKSAAEMLALLRERLTHAPHDEISIAAGEQSKIIYIRLKKLFSA